MFVCIMGVGIYLLISVTRDMNWIELRSNFVSGVSHELKTPLSLIRLYSETLSDDDEEFSCEDRQSYIRIIARESQRLSRLIDNVLSFSTIDQDRKTYSLTEGDLASTVLQTVRDYADYLSLRGFAVEKEIPPDLPPVKFNREQVSQLVLNLMDNARKYSDKSKSIGIRMWQAGSEVVLEVHDHGIGIPAQEQEKIFEPFYRASQGGADKGGFGLGLYLVRHIVVGHGGRIEVHSKVNEGSRFRLFFPLTKTASRKTEQSARLGAANVRSS
jgi:signal transduction histidine kinase